MPKIRFRDFVPPIATRGLKYLRRTLRSVEIVQFTNQTRGRVHPFDSVPVDIEAKWILDVGANRGDVAIAALNSYPNTQVICFEPVKKTFQELSERVKPYMPRVHLFNYALSDKEEESVINITSFHGANSILPQSKYHQVFNPHVREIGKEKISLVMLDKFSINFPQSEIDILKIDVEGYELNVLKGGYEFIAKNVDAIIIEIALARDRSWEEQSVFEIFRLLTMLVFASSMFLIFVQRTTITYWLLKWTAFLGIRVI